MKVKEISSRNNALLQTIRRLDDVSDRQELGLFLIEGTKLIGEAFNKKVDLVDIVVSQSFFKEGLARSGLPALESVSVVEDKVFNSLCTTASSCGILASARIQTHSLEELLKKKTGTLVFGECIQDPGNLGTMIRTALAFEAAGLILSRDSVDHLSPKVVRASMGAVFRLPIVADVDAEASLGRLKASNAQIVALDAKADRTFDRHKLNGRIVYLFGNEGHGLSQTSLKLADYTVSIPINPESESLNVAVAMGIVLYQTRGSLKAEL